MRKFWIGILVGSLGSALVLAVVSVAVDPPVATVPAPDEAAASVSAPETAPEPSETAPAVAGETAPVEPDAEPVMADESADAEPEADAPSAGETDGTATGKGPVAATTDEEPDEETAASEASEEIASAAEEEPAVAGDASPAEPDTTPDIADDAGETDAPSTGPTDETPAADEKPAADGPVAASTDKDIDVSEMSEEVTATTEEEPATTGAEPENLEPGATGPEAVSDPAPVEDTDALAPAPDVSPDAPAAPKIADPAEMPRVRIIAAGKDAPDPIAPIKQGEGALDTASLPGADTDLPPLERYAEPFWNPEDQPGMSVILIDDAESAGSETLAGFPYPVTFAVDPKLPDAPDRMARHRDNGFEVVALMDLSDGMTSGDLGTALDEVFLAVPEAVALLEAPGGDVQSDRALADEVTKIMGETGHGLILQPDGINTVQKLAAQAGVASGVVFRDLDGVGQSSDVVRRFLDQAANRARQQDGVIVIARLRPETVSALVIWGLQDRVNQVALAPVSHLLSARPDD